jgi:hypothetical protein
MLFRRLAPFALVSCSSLYLGCDAAEAPRAADSGAGGERGVYTPGGKADEFATCVGYCDDEAPAGCWCDDECEDWGDCCPDYESACFGGDPDGSACGEEPEAEGTGPGPTTDCLAALEAAGADFASTEHSPEQAGGTVCEIDDPVMLHRPSEDVSLRYFESNQEAAVLLSCEAALSLAQSAAVARSLGVEEIIHMGTYNCRVIAGTSALSQHGLGNAIDIYGFGLDDGSEVTVRRDWGDTGLLRQFADAIWDDGFWNVILTPNYNAAHADHLHLDVTPGGNTYK